MSSSSSLEVRERCEEIEGGDVDPNCGTVGAPTMIEFALRAAAAAAGVSWIGLCVEGGGLG